VCRGVYIGSLRELSGAYLGDFEYFMGRGGVQRGDA
jgi:hypothetical protein